MFLLFCIPDALVLLRLLQLVRELGLGALRVHLGVELRLLQLEVALRVGDLRVARELHVLRSHQHTPRSRSRSHTHRSTRTENRKAQDHSTDGRAPFEVCRTAPPVHTKYTTEYVTEYSTDKSLRVGSVLQISLRIEYVLYIMFQYVLYCTAITIYCTCEYSSLAALE